jgi:CHAT domain-containing protein
MKKRDCLLLFCLFFTQFPIVFGQKANQDSLHGKALLSSVFQYQALEPDKALSYIESLKIFAKTHQMWGFYIEAFSCEGQVYSLKTQWVTAQKKLDEADHLMRVYSEFLNASELSVLKAKNYPRHLFIASMTNDYKRVEMLIQQGLVFKKKTNMSKSDSTMTHYAYYYQYQIENTRRNFTEALRLLNNAQLYAQTNKVPLNAILNYTNYANLRIELKQLDKAEENFNKAASFVGLVKTIVGSQFNVNNLRLAEANFYIKTRNTRRADSCLRLLNTQIGQGGSDVFIKADYAHTEGDLFYQQKQYDKAAVAYNNALNININIFQPNNEEEHKKQNHQIAQNYVNIATVRQKQKRFTEAIKAVYSGFMALDPTFHCDDYRDNPVAAKIFSKQELLKLLNCKTGIMLDWANDQPAQKANYQAIAYRTAKEGIDLMEDIRSSFTNDFDKQDLLELMYPLYEKGISAAFQLYQRDNNIEYLARAFEIFERSKAATLLQAIRTGQAEDDIETSDKFTLLDYRTQVAKLENSLHEALFKFKKDESDPSVTGLKRQLDNLKSRLDVLIKSFETKYPNYYRLKYSRPYAPLADVQKSLPSDESTVLFEYFVGNEDIYIFAVSHGRVQLFKQPKPADFEALVSRFHTLLRTPKGGDCVQYAQLAHQFYALVMQPPLSIFPQKPRKVVIVADGLLCLLPFDGFLSVLPMINLSYRSLPYLIHEHTLLYAYSANAYLEKKSLNRVRQREVFAGFAPEYSSGSDFAPLPNSAVEINQLSALLRGDKYLGKAANERQFKRIADQYRCLHLSMHTDMTEVNPMFTKLVFQLDSNDLLEDNMLTPNEIYKLRLNADLVVLSACETGLGALSNGEGAMSFARAFQYAGVPNTVMSLWVADDEASKNVMIQFYKNLKNGQTKEDAMRNAKRSYLYRAKTEDEAFPFFWLTYNLIGNETDIDLTPPLSKWWIFGVALGVCLLGLGVWWRMRQ